MRFDTGEQFSYFTASAAATCSFTLTASQRNILIDTITCHSDLANATVRIQGSGTTLWQMIVGSASLTQHYPGLSIDGGNAQTLSGFIDGTNSATISICGKYRWL
jgi:hypothetical protein